MFWNAYFRLYALPPKKFPQMFENYCPVWNTGKNFCILDSFVIFDDVYILQHYAFLIFQILSIMQMVRKVA